MGANKDRVKEGRSRIGMLIDDDLLDVIDFAADLEQVSRSNVLQTLIIDALHEREYYQDLRKYPKYREYWKRCMAERGKGAIFEGPIELEYPTENGDITLRDYEDAFEDGIIENFYRHDEEMLQQALERKKKIAALKEEYRSLFEQIQKDREEENKRRERMNMQLGLSDADNKAGNK